MSMKEMLKNVGQLKETVLMLEKLNEKSYFQSGYLVVRLDGKRFSKFTKSLKKPFDEKLSYCMVETTKYLMETYQAIIGYTQSDEITLIFKSDLLMNGGKLDTSLPFSGREQKICSIFAAGCTVKFNMLISENLPEKLSEMPIFDCRAFPVSTKELAILCVGYRQIDALKNSISMAASACGFN